ncbi:cache domain-containing protein, partial [Pseudothermotoga lettingae]
YLDEKSRQNVLEIYGLIEKADSDINYIYSGYRNGMLLINNYEPPEGFDPTIRPWYTAAIESYPEISWGEPYQEIKTKEWLVSVSKALVDEENNITEVLAIDTSLEKLENILWDSDERYRSSYSYVIKEDQQIIIHHDKQHLRHNLSDVVKKSLSFEKNYGSFEYRLNNTEKIAYYSRIENLGWIVITVVNKDEITKPIFSQMGTTILLFIIASSILGWFMSNSFSKKIVIPLLMLKERVNRVIEGKLNGQSISEFPDNEIGTIADDIFRLTGKELYKKKIKN